MLEVRLVRLRGRNKGYPSSFDLRHPEGEERNFERYIKGNS
jgi:hypothetical protein